MANEVRKISEGMNPRVVDRFKRMITNHPQAVSPIVNGHCTHCNVMIPKMLVNEDGTLGNSNEVRCNSIEEKLGIHASPTCVMEYGGKDGAIGYLVGEENEGLNYMFTMMNEARVWVGGQGLSVSTAALQGASQYARDRIQGRPIGMDKESAKNAPIIEHADVRRMLMTMKVIIHH